MPDQCPSKETLERIDDTVFGNGREGLTDRTARLEEQNKSLFRRLDNLAEELQRSRKMIQYGGAGIGGTGIVGAMVVTLILQAIGVI